MGFFNKSKDNKAKMPSQKELADWKRGFFVEFKTNWGKLVTPCVEIQYLGKGKHIGISILFFHVYIGHKL